MADQIVKIDDTNFEIVKTVNTVQRYNLASLSDRQISIKKQIDDLTTEFNKVGVLIQAAKDAGIKTPAEIADAIVLEPVEEIK